MDFLMVADQDRIHRLCGICGVTGAVTPKEFEETCVTLCIMKYMK